jgi:hypothetical protein
MVASTLVVVDGSLVEVVEGVVVVNTLVVVDGNLVVEVVEGKVIESAPMLMPGW